MLFARKKGELSAIALALTRGLRQFELTKAEKLQVVNLAPTEPVELYVVRDPAPITSNGSDDYSRSSKNWKTD